MSSVAAALVRKGCPVERVRQPLAFVYARVVRQHPLVLEVQALGIGVLAVGEEVVALSDDAKVVDREGKTIRGAYAMTLGTFDPHHAVVPLDGEVPQRALPLLASRRRLR